MERLDWVKPYYTRAGDYWGPAGIGERDTKRVETARRLHPGNGNRMLELGAGAGETALAMANAGWDVVAVEFAPTRAAQARELAERAANLTVVEADFYIVDLNERFEIVCYWDGFGIGSDSDQRRLLKRIASDWLKPNGCAIVEIFSPWQWARVVGREQRLDRNHPSHRYRQRRTAEFDPVNSCFIDTWTPIDDTTGEPDEGMAITQVIRCYSPADFLLLLEGTGLKAEYAEIDGEPFELSSAGAASRHPIWQSWSYLVRLAPEQ
ncbi:MAG TPA: class I SAM-dependent methyltransferase [Capsulimonadaceae bacterium]|nr:class I SAM-dependent methyltransferase [Capsulimonadaceae bacterium]